MLTGITRPVGRVRIETYEAAFQSWADTASPGRLAGCGLKRSGGSDHRPSSARITRPVGRVRIETRPALGRCAGLWRITRPVGRVRIETHQFGERPLIAGGITRPVGRVRIETAGLSLHLFAFKASPGRLAGCGLKHAQGRPRDRARQHHPAGWPGAD